MYNDKAVDDKAVDDKVDLTLIILIWAITMSVAFILEIFMAQLFLRTLIKFISIKNKKLYSINQSLTSKNLFFIAWIVFLFILTVCQSLMTIVASIGYAVVSKEKIKPLEDVLYMSMATIFPLKDFMVCASFIYLFYV